MAGKAFTVTLTALLVTAHDPVPVTIQVMLAVFSAIVGFVIVKVDVVKLE